MKDQNNSEIPHQFNVSHIFAIHQKNLPHLMDKEPDDPIVLTARKDFYSGFLSALSFLHLSLELRTKERDFLVYDTAESVVEAKISGEEVMLANFVVNQLKSLVTMATGNIEDMNAKIEEMKQEVKVELVKLAKK